MADRGSAFKIQELPAILGRRARLVLGLTAALTALGVLVLHRLPDAYSARSVVYLDLGQMPKGSENTGVQVPRLSQAVATISQEILSRGSLALVIRDLDLYGTGEATAAPAPGADDYERRLLWGGLVERARRDIAIQIIKIYNEDFVQIDVDARTGDLAARAVNRIADLFARKNHEQRLERARQVNAILEREVEKSARRVRAAEAAVQRYQEQHNESLPEVQRQLFVQLAAVQERMHARKRAIDEAGALEAAADSRLRGLLLGNATALDPHDPMSLATLRSTPERVNLEAELHRLEMEEAELALRYVDPDFSDRAWARAKVEATRRKLAALRAAEAMVTPAEVAVAAAPEAASATALAAGVDATVGEKIVADLVARNAPPTVIATAQLLVADLVRLRRTVEDLGREQEKDAKEEARLEAITASVGAVQGGRDKLQNAYVEAEKVHLDLVKDHIEAQKFLAAESGMTGSQLRTIEPAEPPILPSKPNRPLLAAAGLLASLLLGCVIAYLLERRRPAYYTRDQVEEDLGIGVLGGVPDLPRPELIAAGDVFVVVEDEDEEEEAIREAA